MTDSTQHGSYPIPEKPDSTERSSIRRLYNASGFSVLFFIVVYIFLSPFLLQFIAGTLINATPIQAETLLVITSCLLAVLAEGAAILIGCRLLGITVRSLFGTEGFNGKTIIITYISAQGFGYMASFIGLALTFLLAQFIKTGIGDLYPSTLITTYSPVGEAIFTFYGILLAPFLEEMLCRGVVLKSLKTYNHNFAVFISALTFGLLHGNIQQFCYTFLVGVIFASVAIRYNSILPTVIAHIFMNILGLIFKSVFTLSGIMDMAEGVLSGGLDITGVLSVKYMAIQALMSIFIIGMIAAAITIAVIHRRRFREFFTPANRLGKTRSLPVFITSAPWIIVIFYLCFTVLVRPFTG